MTRGLRSGLLALVVLAVAQAGASPAGAALTCDKIPQLAGHFLRKHVSHRTLNEELVRRTAEAYLEYGVTQDWTVIGVLPYRLPETGDPVPNPTISPPTTLPRYCTV